MDNFSMPVISEVIGTQGDPSVSSELKIKALRQIGGDLEIIGEIDIKYILWFKEVRTGMVLEVTTLVLI